MATTTHGFPYPTSTGLVKDAPTNFYDLATTVDTKMGLYLISSTTVTSGTNPTISFDNVFSSLYDNYRLLIDSFQPSIAARGLCIRLRNAGSDLISNYVYAFRGIYTNGTGADNWADPATFFDTSIYNSANTIAIGAAVIDIFAPQKAERTHFISNACLYNSVFGTRNGIGEQNDLTACDGFTLLLTGIGNITKVRIKIYGWNN